VHKTRVSSSNLGLGELGLPEVFLDNLNLSNVKAVFFDFGETLATVAPSKEDLFIRAARSLGLKLEFEDVQRAYQIVDFHNKYSSVHVRDRDGFYQLYNEQLAEALGISSHLARLHPALVAQFSNRKWQLFEETPQVLDRLRHQSLPVALVANWDSNLSDLVDQLGIRQEFLSIVSSQAAGVEKPDPAIFLRAVDELSLSVETDRILYVGNEYRADVIGARAAGLIPVLIDRSSVYKHADCLRFASLVEWLEKMQ
jgi:putative hydrolase of the HAD superfamily